MQTAGLQNRAFRVQVPVLLPKFCFAQARRQIRWRNSARQSASLTKRKPVVRIHPPAPSVAVV